MTQDTETRRVMTSLWILLGLVGIANAIYDPANSGFGIKTKTYRGEPTIGNTYEQHTKEPEQELLPPESVSYQRTTNIERLSSSSPVHSKHISSSSYNGNNYQEYQPLPLPLSPQLLQTHQGQNQYQHQQGNDYYHQEQKFQYDDRQQEIPLYESSTVVHNAVGSNRDELENSVTEYFTGCPDGHTGSLPYAYDCRLFINCWHGRAHITTCSAGTAFNPETLECDRSDKVVCGTLSALGEATQANYQKLEQKTPTKRGKYRAGHLIDAASDDVEILCSNGASGLQPHPKNCSKFINCANGNIHVMECGPGTAYSIPMMVCDYKEKVDCSGRDFNYFDESFNIRSNRLKPVGVSKHKGNDVTCPPGVSGLFPHPFDCTKFLNCANGQTFIQDCGPGTAFDKVQKVCGFKQGNCHSETSASDNDNGNEFQHGWTDDNAIEEHDKHANTDRRNIGLFWDVDILCPAGVTGHFVHPFDYTKFLNCSNRGMSIKSCETDEIFSITKGFCDSRERIQFTDHVAFIVSELDHKYSQMLTSCPPGIEGLHLYPFDCKKYIKCASSRRLLVLECPPNNVFSIFSRKCVAEEQVSRLDRVKYLYELTKNIAVKSEINRTSSMEIGRMIALACPLNTEGSFPHPFANTKYVVCYRGQMLIETCGSGKAFSLSKKECRLRDSLKLNDFVLFPKGYSELSSSEFDFSYDYKPGSFYFVCPLKIDDGMFLHPFDCTKYIHCRKGNAHIESCTAGTTFSISRGECIQRDQVEAFDRVEYLIDTQHEFSSDSTSSVNSSLDSVFCPKDAVGLYAHPYDPQKYLQCRGNVVLVKHCSPGTLYSISRRHCLMENEVPDYDRSSFSTNARDFDEPVVACPRGEDGTHPHPYDCTKFLDCLNGTTHIKNCGPGTAWNIAMEVCDFKDNVDCTGRQGDQRSSSTKPIKTNNESTISSKTNDKIKCPVGIRDGYYPNPFDYTKFFFCNRGQSILGRCSQGTIFSISKRSCELKSQIDGRDHVLLITETMITDELQSYDFVTCPKGAIGLYIYPFDASKYVRCDNGRTVIENCNHGSVFNEQHKICMPSEQVDQIYRVPINVEIENGWHDSQHSINHKDSSIDAVASHLKSVVRCPLDANGLHPHPYDCTKFLNCANGETIVQSCGPGTAWSSDMEVCDFKDKVNCSNRSNYNWESDHGIVSQNPIASSADKIQCTVNIGDGFYPHPFDETKYFICQYGQSFLGQCREGNVFSISRRLCDSPSKVIANDRVILPKEFLSQHDIGMNQRQEFVICPTGTVGVTLFPFDCKKFVKCEHGLTFIETCPPDTVFSLANRKCLSKQLVESIDRVAFVEETQNELYYRKNNEANMLIFCPMGFTGSFQHPYDWKKYLECINGQSVVKVCPSGTVFSVSRGACDLEVNVSYDDRCHSDHQRYDATKYGLNGEQIVESSPAIKSTTPECPSGASGLYPHPYDCFKFLNCDNGKTYVENCGPRTAWNPKTNACDFEDNVDCSNRKPAFMGKPVAKGIAVQCPAGASGMLPHPYDCTKFLNCADGITNVLACGPGTAWSIDMEVCDFIANVDCTNRERSQYHNSRGSKSYGSSNQRDHGTFGQESLAGSIATKTQTDRWTNMNMNRPDANSYGHRHKQTVGSGTWTTTQHQVDADYNGGYGHTGGIDQPHRTSVTTDSGDSNWSGVGSAVEQKTPGKNELVMEGSFEPNRNYVKSFHTYTSPLAPFSTNSASNFTSTTTATATGTKKTVYAQPVTSQESIDEPYVNFSGTRPSYHPLPNMGTPIVRHESTLETHTVQLPNQQLVPPHDTPSSRSLVTQSIDGQFFPQPPIYSDGEGQEALDFDESISDSGQFEISNDDQLQSASEYRPTASISPVQEPNVVGILMPPPIDSSNQQSFNSYGQPNPNRNSKPNPISSTKLTPVMPYDDHLRPPTSYASDHQISSAQSKDTSNVHVFQIYPSLHNVTSFKSFGDPHYSSPYSGVAHSRNTTWKSSYVDDDDASESLSSSPSTTNRKTHSMPPAYNHKYYSKTPAESQSPQMATDFVDTDMPVSEALRMLLHPYFNRSGTVRDDDAKPAESHIMNLVADSQQSTTTLTSNFNAFPNSDSIDQQKQTEEDVEFILAGEQSYLGTVATKNTTHETRSDQTNSNHPYNWQKSLSHTTEFHQKYPNNLDESQHHHNIPHAHPHGHNHHHNHHHASYHSRDFHIRHPEMPSPFVSKEGDKSIDQTDSLVAANPYAEPTTPKSNVYPSTRFSVQNKCEFDCGNGKCVRSAEICDGVNNCGNRKDESECNHLGYEVRLTGGESRNMGRIEVKIGGKWGYVCDDKFGLRDADVVCRELGFNLGASEIRGSSYYPPLELNFSVAMDEVECHGNETSLKDCDFKGWGVHNCGPDEVAGVVCKAPSFKCPNDYWLCNTSKECIPPAFLCDNTPDCADQSDESEQVCKAPIEYRLEGGRNRNEGRLEIKYRGEWGTVCDDDFGIKEAQVVCNSLGYYGKPEIEKNIYGPGSGPIWLDQVSCLGNETSIDKCNHWTWGEHNCNHTEDVGVHCKAGPPPHHLKQNQNPSKIPDETDEDVQEQYPFDEAEFYQNLQRSSKFLQSQKNCGHFKPNIFDEYAHPEERVINGTIAKRGRHPWQATIRTRGRGGISSHWCGAVLIGDGSKQFSSHLLTAAHCLAGYQKGAYFIRMGDHYSNIAESSEIDSYIENWYIHEKFRDQTHMNNDIALIMLKSPVRFNDYIQPVCLPEKGDRVHYQRECTISGWGSIKSGISTPSNILRAAKVPILPDETCKQRHVYGASLTEGMFCAGSMDESVDACDGDSGGPLVCSDDGAETLHGIISWGQHCGYANKPGVYVRIEKYVDWIYEKINFSLQQNKKNSRN